MDIYSTVFLNTVVESLLRPQNHFLNKYFPTIVLSEDKEIKFDREDGKRRLAPFVSPKKEGKVVTSLGYQTETFKPAYIKDKRVFDPDSAFKRVAGERIGGTLKPMQRHQRAVVTAIKDQNDMTDRRLEVMAAEVLMTGGVTIKGEDYPETHVDYNRASNQTIALSGGAVWGPTTANCLTDIEDWSRLILKSVGVSVHDVYMDLKAYKKFMACDEVKDVMNTRRGSEAKGESAHSPQQGAVKKATIDNCAIWVYEDYYEDPDDKTTKPMLPANTVILPSPYLEGERHFGAIMDLKAKLQPREKFVKSWEEEDPSVRYLLMQCAPLVAARRSNASVGITVA